MKKQKIVVPIIAMLLLVWFAASDAGVTPMIVGNTDNDSVWIDFSTNDTLGNAADCDSAWVIRWFGSHVWDSVKVTSALRTGYYKTVLRASKSDSTGGYSINVRVFGLTGRTPNTNYSYTVVDGGAVGQDAIYDPSTDSVLVDGSAFASLAYIIGGFTFKDNSITANALNSNAALEIARMVFDQDSLDTDSSRVGRWMKNNLKAIEVDATKIAGSIEAAGSLEHHYVETYDSTYKTTKANLFQIYNHDAAALNLRGFCKTAQGGIPANIVLIDSSAIAVAYGILTDSVWQKHTAAFLANDSTFGEIIGYHLDTLLSNIISSAATPAQVRAMIDSAINDSNLARYVTRADYQSTTGPGATPVRILARDTANAASVSGVKITVKLPDGTEKHRTITGTDGWANMTLETGERYIYAAHNNYSFTTPACTLTVPSDSLRDTVWATVFDPGDPDDPTLKRLYGWVTDPAGTAIESVSVSLRLQRPSTAKDTIPHIITSGQVVKLGVKSTLTDSTGYWYIDVIPINAMNPWMFYQLKGRKGYQIIPGMERKIYPTGTNAENVADL